MAHRDMEIPSSGPSGKFGVVVFPGSNCDHDAYHVLKNVFHQDVRFLWHKDSSLEGVDAVILPGGFSYGDYLRSGAIARFSPIMKEVISFANAGGMVIGICNGFQILCEAGLLPGSLLRNAGLTFACRYVHVRVENTATAFTSACAPGEVLKIPIAHGEGNYYADPGTLEDLAGNNRIIFRYCDPAGAVTDAANPNGSVRGIAGIVNERGNVMGLMPHPERASDPVLRETDGAKIFVSAIGHLAGMSHFTHAALS
jgi:phosphoribosylformylglycinamidine synthase I